MILAVKFGLKCEKCLIRENGIGEHASVEPIQKGFASVTPPLLGGL